MGEVFAAIVYKILEHVWGMSGFQVEFLGTFFYGKTVVKALTVRGGVGVGGDVQTVTYTSDSKKIGNRINPANLS